MANYRIQKSRLQGTVVAPPSKSHTLRAILFASLAKGESTIHNVLASPDAKAMIAACKQLGAEIIETNHTLRIRGVSGKLKTPDNIIDAGNSGQVLRFVSAICALQNNYVVITGDHSVRTNRPFKPLMEALKQLNVFCESTKGNAYAPIIIKGPLQPGVTELSGEDSQPVSGLLMACAFADGESTIIVRNPGEKPWVALTLDWFDRLGIPYENNQFEKYIIPGNAKIDAFEYTVPGDFSSIAFPLVAAILTRSEITIENIDMTDCQGDKRIIDILISMGANIEVDKKNNRLFVYAGSTLTGKTININDCIDAITILAVVGCYAKGVTTIAGAEIARKKECDRVAAIVCELKKMGADIEETGDGLVVKSSNLSGANVKTYNDHRMVMSLAIAGLAASGETHIDDVASVAKSYPNFLEHMQALAATMEVIE